MLEDHVLAKLIAAIDSGLDTISKDCKIAHADESTLPAYEDERQISPLPFFSPTAAALAGGPRRLAIHKSLPNRVPGVQKEDTPESTVRSLARDACRRFRRMRKASDDCRNGIC